MKQKIAKLLKTKKGKLTAVLILAGLSVLTFWSYNVYQVRADKQRFEQASNAIDSIYKDIVIELGQPDNYKRSNSCTRPYQEFTGYGAPTCHLDAIFIYGVANEEVAVNKMNAIQLVINRGRLLIQTTPSSQSIQETVVAGSRFRMAGDSYRFRNLSCAVNYVFDTPQETSLKIQNKNESPLEVTIGCYGPAKDAHYPLAY